VTGFMELLPSIDYMFRVRFFDIKGFPEDQQHLLIANEKNKK
jgi:hypothetical protein